MCVCQQQQSGFVTALVAYLDEASKEVPHSVNDSVSPAINGSKAAAVSTVAGSSAPELPGDATERIARFIAAVCEDKALSKFEAAVLSEICEQQPGQVLSVMRSSKKTIAQKKQFLVNLAHFGHGDDEGAKAAAANPSASTSKQNGSSHPSRLGNVPLPSSSSGSSSATAQVELVYKKLLEIARNVFSPEVQTEILAAASSYRASPTFNGGSSAGAKPQSEAGLGQKLELIGIIEKLLSKHALPEEQAAYLLRLVLTENRLLLSALQSYKIDYNLGDLEKAVKQIAALGAGAAAPSSSSATNGASANGTSKSPKKRSSPRKTPRAPQALKGFVARPIDILHSMHQKQMITSLEYDILGALVKQQDPQVFAAIDEFQRTRDQATLRDTLVFIVEEITMELGDEEKAHFMRSLSIEHTLNVSTVDWQEQLFRYVHHWAERMVLNPEHVMVLEKLIAENHNLLQSAYEVFAGDEDENELLDTLQRIAKLQLQAEEGAALQLFSQVVNAHCDVLRENEKALVKQLFVRRNELVRAAWEVFEVEKNVHDLGDTLLRIARFTSRNDSKLRLVEVVGEMMRRKLIRSHEGDGLIRLYEEKNEAMLAANEAFESDGDIKELVETLLLVVKHANFGEPPICSPRHSATKNLSNYSQALMPPSPSLSVSEQFESGTEEYVAARLIDTLAKKGRLSDWQRELLLTLLSQNDDRLLAAIDVYNEDQHARELVDTLWRLCDLLVWEENKRSIIREWVMPLEQEGRVARGVLQQLIDARDDRIMAAFVVYLGDSDDEEFVDTLTRIARIALTSFSGAKVKRDDDASATEDVDLEFDVEEAESVLASLVENGQISENDAAGVRSLFTTTHNAQVLAAFDVFHTTEDSEDLADTLSRIVARHSSTSASSPLSPSKSKIARMEKQLLHFASELGLAPNELAALKRSIARQDEILTAAVEVYEMENDEVCGMI